MNKFNTVLSVLAIVLVGGLILLDGTGSNGLQGERGVPGLNGTNGKNGVDGARGLQGPAGPRGLPGTNQFGALTGPIIPFNFLQVGGIKEQGVQIALTQSTSTPCAIQSPNATSTFLGGGIRFDTATATVLEVEFAKSTTAFASTTRIGSLQRVTASTKGTLLATSSVNVLENTPFSPNDWFVVKVSAPEATTNIHNNGTGFVPEGACQSKWRV